MCLQSLVRRSVSETVSTLHWSSRDAHIHSLYRAKCASFDAHCLSPSSWNIRRTFLYSKCLWKPEFSFPASTLGRNSVVWFNSSLSDHQWACSTTYILTGHSIKSLGVINNIHHGRFNLGIPAAGCSNEAGSLIALFMTRLFFLLWLVGFLCYSTVRLHAPLCVARLLCQCRLHVRIHNWSQFDGFHARLLFLLFHTDDGPLIFLHWPDIQSLVTVMGSCYLRHSEKHWSAILNVLYFSLSR